MGDLLVDDHAELDLLLRDLLAEFELGGAGDLLAKLDLVWARLAVHIRAEHLHLFPALLKASKGTRHHVTAAAPSAEEVHGAIERLREDHDFFMRELAEGVNTLRGSAMRGDPASAEPIPEVKRRVVAVCERLQGHNRLEEEQVYLWQGVLLDADERGALLALMRREIENLPPRFSRTEPG